MTTWKPIATEPQDDTRRLVTFDPSDPEAAHLVSLLPDGNHFNGDVVIEGMTGEAPTHWAEVPKGQAIDREALIAKTLYNWFDRTEGEWFYSPYPFNADPDKMTISVDGELDCRVLAAALERALSKS